MSDQTSSTGSPNPGTGTQNAGPATTNPPPVAAAPVVADATKTNATSASGPATNNSGAAATGNGTGTSATGNGSGTGFTGLGTTSTSGAPKRTRSFFRSFMLMNLLLLAAGGAVFGVRHYMHLTGMFFDPDPDVIIWSGAIALGLSVLFTGVFAWRARSFKRTLGVFFGSLFGSLIPLLLVFGVCFVTIEYRYRAADSAQQFLTEDKTEFDFAREYHAVTIHEQLQANHEAAVRIAELDRREKELSMGIAILRNVEDTAGIGHAATDTAVNSIETTAKFAETRAAQSAKLLSPEQVSRLTAVENAACYIGHDVGVVKETNYRDCAFTEKNLLDLQTKLHWEYSFWGAVHGFVQEHVPSLTAKLLP